MSEAPTTPNQPVLPNDESDEVNRSSSLKRKRGRKKGCKLDLISLASGGSGRQRRGDNAAGLWDLDATRADRAFNSDSDYDSEDDSSFSDSSSVSDLEEEDDDYDEFEESEDECITDMKGNRILPIHKIGKVVRNSCAARYAH